MRRTGILVTATAAVLFSFLAVEGRAERSSDRTYDFESLSVDTAFIDYYRAHAKVRLMPGEPPVREL